MKTLTNQEKQIYLHLVNLQIIYKHLYRFVPKSDLEYFSNDTGLDIKDTYSEVKQLERIITSMEEKWEH